MRRFAKNLLSLVGSDLVRRLIGFVAVTVLTRRITAADFGAVNLGFTVLSYGLILSSAGLPTLGVREVARGAGYEIARRIAGLRLLLSGAAYALIALILTVSTADTALIRLLLLFTLSLFPMAASLEWFFQGKEEMELLGIGRAVSALAYLVGIVLFVRSPSDLPAVAISAVVGDVVAAAFFFGVYRSRYRSAALEVSVRGAGKLLREALPMNIGSTIAQASANLGMIVVALLLTRIDLGMFSAATKLVVFLLAADRAVATLLLPASSRLLAASPAGLSAKLGVALKWIILVGLPLGIGGTLLAGRIVPAVFGAEYAAAAPLFQVGVWFVLVTMAHTVYTSGLLAAGGEKRYARVMALGLALNAVLLVAGTLLYGTLGAMAAVVVAELATTVLMQREFARNIALPLPPALGKILAASAAMGAALLLLPPLPLAAAVAAGCVVYAAALLLMNAVSVREVTALVRRSE